MDRTLALMLVAALAFTLTACGDETGGGVTPTVDLGQQDTGVDTGLDVGELDVGPDVAEDTGPDAEEDMGEDISLPPIDLTGTWTVVRTDDALEVATLAIEQDGQFIEGTVQMASNEVFDGSMGIIGSVVINDTERTVSLEWFTNDEQDQHLINETDYEPEEMQGNYVSPDGLPSEVTITKVGE